MTAVCWQHLLDLAICAQSKLSCQSHHLHRRNLYFKTAKVRPSTPNVKQQYIMPSSMFEFGPLLAGRDRTGYQTGCYPEHTAKFRITNNGLFKAHADFWLKSEGPGADPAHAGAVADTKKKPGKHCCL
jgi:hypothetical protein